MKLKFHLSAYFVPLRPLSRVASDYSSGSVVWNGILRPFRPLREIKIIAFFHAKNAKSAKFCFPLCFTLALKGSQTSLRQECAESYIPPPPPAGYSTLSQGESLLQQNITAPADCPPETGGTRSVATEGVDVFRLSVHHDHPAMLKVSLRNTCFSICRTKVSVTITKCFKTRR